MSEKRGYIPLKWHSCYDESWKGLIVDEAFSHPAKFARGLIERIVTHGIAKGYFSPGQTIGDPFGGVALGGIICGYHGLNWRGVELEGKFCDLGEQNLALHRPKFKALGYDVDVRIVRGDSRQFARLVQADAIVTSPPFVESLGSSDKQFRSEGLAKGAGKWAQNRSSESVDRLTANYGTSPGQIGRLKSGSVDAVITSPPFTEDQPCASQTRAIKDYHAFTRGDGTKRDHQMKTPGNIGNLKQGSIDAAITSPPYAGIRQDGTIKDGGGFGSYSDGQTAKWHTELDQRNIGNLGDETNIKRESYWTAMHAVYTQVHLALPPGGVMAVVLKDYVKAGQRVPLVDDTLKLLVSIGFEPIERIHAMLTKETRQPDLFGGEIVKRKEKKSFFRRLAESKGSPAIDYEEVLFVRKRTP